MTEVTERSYHVLFRQGASGEPGQTGRPGMQVRSRLHLRCSFIFTIPIYLTQIARLGGLHLPKYINYARPLQLSIYKLSRNGKPKQTKQGVRTLL